MLALKCYIFCFDLFLRCNKQNEKNIKKEKKIKKRYLHYLVRFSESVSYNPKYNNKLYSC